MIKFISEKEALKYFDEIEECKCCGEFSASWADHDNGGIVLCHDGVYDRICLTCDLLLS